MLTFTNEFVNFTMDGNSLVVPNRIGEKLMNLAPISGGMTYKNVALGGRTFMAMRANVGNVHNSFVAGKQNLLFILEGVNSASAGLDGPGIVRECINYLKEVKSVHPEWRIYIIIAFASQDDANPSARNAAVDYYNNYVRKNYLSLGVEGYVETRPPGGPLAYNPPYTYTSSNFARSGLYQDGTHLNAAGNDIVAQYIADMLPTIPDVAPTAGGGSSGGGGEMIIGFTFT
jgi:hypothetical protein